MQNGVLIFPLTYTSAKLVDLKEVWTTTRIRAAGDVLHCSTGVLRVVYADERRLTSTGAFIGCMTWGCVSVVDKFANRSCVMTKFRALVCVIVVRFALSPM